jgi:hypothetical protein
MEQLIRQTDKSSTVWSAGSAPFRAVSKTDAWSLTVAVQCRIEDLESDYFALLDTGAEWSVIGEDVLTLIKDRLDSPIRSLKMSTRFGMIFGELHRVNITLLTAPGQGADLTVESTAFVSEEWEGPTVLGYRGFLERIRFAFDPGVVPGEQIFYFGPAE